MCYKSLDILAKDTIAIAFALVLGSCSLFSTERPSDWYYSGEATAVKNGEAWEARPYAVSSDDSEVVDFIMHVAANRSDLGQRLWFPEMPKRVGRFPVPTHLRYNRSEARPIWQYITSRADDIAGDYYSLVETEENYVEITYYDETTGEIGAEFALTVAIDRRLTGPSAPDTIRFEQGSVVTRIVDGDDL